MQHVSKKAGTYPPVYMASLFYPEDGGSMFLGKLVHIHQSTWHHSSILKMEAAFFPEN
jgi:hypothetical protein